jgi:hypothetical protein
VLPPRGLPVRPSQGLHDAHRAGGHSLPGHADARGGRAADQELNHGRTRRGQWQARWRLDTIRLSVRLCHAPRHPPARSLPLRPRTCGTVTHPPLFTRCSHAVHTLFTRCAHAVHTLCTRCSHAVHTLCTRCAHAVHTLFTRCAHAVHTLFTRGQPDIKEKGHPMRRARPTPTRLPCRPPFARAGTSRQKRTCLFWTLASGGTR